MKTTAGFTLLEGLIAMWVASILLAALIVGEVTLLRTFDSCDRYTSSQMASERLVDYIGVDLRRAVKVQADTNTGGSRAAFVSGSLTLDGSHALSILVPEFYGSDSSNSSQYRTPSLPVTTDSNTVEFLGPPSTSGTGGMWLLVRYLNTYNAQYGSNCIIREERQVPKSDTAGTNLGVLMSSRVVAEKVGNMSVSIQFKKTSDNGNPVYVAQGWFVPSFSQRSGVTAVAFGSTTPGRIVTVDTVMLRNPQQ